MIYWKRHISDKAADAVRSCRGKDGQESYSKAMYYGTCIFVCIMVLVFSYVLWYLYFRMYYGRDVDLHISYTSLSLVIVSKALEKLCVTNDMRSSNLII